MKYKNRLAIVFLAIFFPLLITNCTKEIGTSMINITSSQFGIHSDSNKISHQDIVSYLKLFKGVLPTKGDGITITPILNDADTVFFLINYDEGWELLSADKRTPRVLMKCLSGNIDYDGLFFNETQGTFLQNLADNISLLSKGNYNNTIYRDSIVFDYVSKVGQSRLDTLSSSRDYIWPYSQQLDTTYVEQQDHLCQTTWGQGSPWNIYSPYKDATMAEHCYTGCVPVATAQILYYLHDQSGFPDNCYGYYSAAGTFIPTGHDHIVLSDSDVNYSQWGDQWSSMPLHWQGSGNFGTVSSLMTHIGHKIGAFYYNDKTAAYSSLVPNVILNEFDISSSSSTDSTHFKNIIYQQIINNSQPVYASIERIIPQTDSTAGHAIVIDGFRRETYVVDYYKGRDSGLVGPGGIIAPIVLWMWDHSETTVTDFVAINWGWNGYGNSSAGSTIWYNYNAGWLVGSNNYTTKKRIIYGFQSN